jgi:hypothetical protein
MRFDCFTLTLFLNFYAFLKDYDLRVIFLSYHLFDLFKSDLKLFFTNVKFELKHAQKLVSHFSHLKFFKSDYNTVKNSVFLISIKVKLSG